MAKSVGNKNQGIDLDFSGLADITGDGKKEYLFGVTIGAAAGSELEIYQWINNAFKKLLMFLIIKWIL